MLLRHILRPLSHAVKPIRRGYHSTSYLLAKQFPPRVKINEEDITEAFLRGSGPGGQKINKTSSAVQLKHIPTGIVVKSQATRSRSQNRKIAREVLAEKLEVLEKGDQSRTMIKAEINRKKKASKNKKSKRKYRALDEAKRQASEAGDLAEDDVEGGEMPVAGRPEELGVSRDDIGR